MKLATGARQMFHVKHCGQEVTLYRSLASGSIGETISREIYPKSPTPHVYALVPFPPHKGTLVSYPSTREWSNLSGGVHMTL